MASQTRHRERSRRLVTNLVFLAKSACHDDEYRFFNGITEVFHRTQNSAQPSPPESREQDKEAQQPVPGHQYPVPAPNVATWAG